MNIRDFNKIIVVSLCDSFTDVVAKALSQNLDMMFCNTKELIEYELIDKKKVQEVCSKEYLQLSERRVMKHIASFVNVVVSINFDYLINNFDVLKAGALVVFVKLSKTFLKANDEVVNLIAYDTRTAKLKDLAHLQVNTIKTDTNFVCNKIIENLGGIL